ncbi:hypothetical protein IDAT_01515 [Pseudidiomarina atlantica]|jgi:uncharacterized membrane protein (UPF0127 family)|uniref:DUF192 domain-containing protein n=1 Tax=Pseudidiomarina atlantica TaxID=1517416 RepID=A0A094JB64_9GAMM|nr:DUF192 domain-containing protein [Pseudidiomarina atlantica]KFZ29801.1 hypothetical protein IDAT_01515 [Pseudidiomarina atlantica]
MTLSILTLLLAGFTAQDSCSTAAEDVCSYDTTQLCQVGVSGQPPMQVEIADNFDKRARGLMHRTELAPHHGMWFVYNEERPGYSGFWMYNTKIALDIAYLDAQMRVVKTFTMRPCTSVNSRNCPSYRPGTNYKSALEMPAGYFAEHGIREGVQLQQCENKE